MGTHETHVGYARVSTIDQNPELQLDALRGAGCTKIFLEKVSSAKEVRPQLAAALDYLRPGDTLIVWKLDRLARSMKQLIETVDLLKTQGIGFRSLTEAIDTTSAAGELFFHIFGALAQFERSIIRERTNAGIKAALARGRKGGRPQKVTETDMRAALTLLQDPEISVRAAAKRLGLSVSTLYRHAPGLRGRVEVRS
jgi:DNA invertase Pin-like site-specific DNA recombinase